MTFVKMKLLLFQTWLQLKALAVTQYECMSTYQSIYINKALIIMFSTHFTVFHKILVFLNSHSVRIQTQAQFCCKQSSCPINLSTYSLLHVQQAHWSKQIACLFPERDLNINMHKLQCACCSWYTSYLSLFVLH